MNIFDIIIFSIILYGAFQGYRRGLFSGLINLIGRIMGLVVAAKEYPRVFSWINEYTPLGEWIRPIIYKMMLPKIQSQAEVSQQSTLESILSVFPQEIREFLRNNLTNDLQIYSQGVIEEIALSFSTTLTDNILKLISFILTYLVIVLIIHIISLLILGPLGLMSGVLNRGGGLIFGGLSSFILISILVGLLSPLAAWNKESPWSILQEAQTYPIMMETYSYLMDNLKINLDKGLTLPLDMDKLPLDNIPIPEIPENLIPNFIPDSGENRNLKIF